ncbi:MAG: hypothetical protein ABSE49_13280 [Polyangiaceae bacterium]
MPQRRMVVGRVLCVAWRAPESEDLVAVIDELRQARARLGRKLLYLSVIGPKSLPEGKVRDALVGFYRDILANCDSMHVVLEGNEFELSIKRSVIANVLLVVQGRGRVFIENTLERVRDVSPSEVRTELSEAMRAAAATSHFAYARSEPPVPPKP